MAALDYSKLNRVQKTAVFLIVIGQEAAVQLVRTFTDGELEAVCREMAKLPVIDNTTRQEAFDEFSSLVDMGYEAALGGTSYVRSTLELARGEHRAAYLLERVLPDNAPAGESTGTAQFEGVDTRQIFSLVKGEQPQTVAFLLSQLDLPKAGEILRMLDAEQRGAVVECLGEMDSISPEVVQRLANQFNRRGEAAKTPAPAQRPGGAPFVASLLKTMDKETSRSLLAVLQDRNAELSDTIRKKLFAFEDLAGLATPDLQRILREVEPAELATALKGPKGEALLKKFTGVMSKRAAESMVEEIAMLPPVRPKDQEAAQDRVLTVVRRLEEQGDITLDQEGDGGGA